MVIRVKCMHIPTQQMFPTYRMFHAVPMAPTPRMFVSCRWSGFAIQTL